MALQEQTYRGHKRIYYQGRAPDFDESKRTFKDVFYLTTSIVYAVSYAGEKGNVSSYVLKKDLNIFNAKSKQDYNKLKDVLSNDLLSYLDRLADEDWVFEDDLFEQTTKIKFIEIIKSLGYDGFFNYEVDKKFLRRMKKSPYWDFMNKVMIDNPSIGVFDESNLIKVDDNIDFKSESSYKEFSDLEKNFIAYNLLNLLKNDKFDDEHKYMLYKSLCNSLMTLSKDETYELVFSYDKDFILNNSKDFMKKFEYLKEANNPYKCIIRTYGARSWLLHTEIINKNNLFKNLTKLI